MRINVAPGPHVGCAPHLTYGGCQQYGLPAAARRLQRVPFRVVAAHGCRAVSSSIVGAGERIGTMAGAGGALISEVGVAGAGTLPPSSTSRTSSRAPSGVRAMRVACSYPRERAAPLATQ